MQLLLVQRRRKQLKIDETEIYVASRTIEGRYH